MKSFISIILILLASIDNITACSCKAQPELTVMQMNDSELIFTATLEEYKIGMAAGSLKLKPKQVYKGALEESITIYFKLKDSHTLFSKSVKFEEQKDWIIFARKKVIGERKYYRLIDSEISTFCALSRPVIEKKGGDSFLRFLNETGNQSNGEKQFSDSENNLIAKGFYKENAPTGF